MKDKNYAPITELRFKIVGVAIKTLDRLGIAHSEEVYDSIFRVDLEKAGFDVTNKPKLLLKDANGKVVKTYLPDLRVRHKGLSVLVELKADPQGLQASHKRQAEAYLSSSQKDQAVFLINFGRKKKNMPEIDSVFRKDL